MPSPSPAHIAPDPETPPIAAGAPSPASPLVGYGLAAAGAILFSAKGIIIKLAYAEGVDTETLLALRMALALPFYVAVGLLASGRGRGLDGRTLAAICAVGALGYWFASYADFLGLNHISAPFGRLILFTYPLFVVLLGAAFFRQPFQPLTLFAFALSYAGLAVVFVQDVQAAGVAATQAGAALVLASAIAFALYQLMAKPLIGRLGPALFTSIAMTAAAGLAIGQFLAVRDVATLSGLSARAWAIAAVLATVGTVLPTFLLSMALHRISAQANSVISTMSPVATLLLAGLLLGEPITMVDVAGTALVLAGVGWFTLSGRRAG